MVITLRRILLAVLCVFLCLEGVRAACSSGYIECKTGGQCIAKKYVCDRAVHCTDGSDEDPAFCEVWTYKSSHCQWSSENFYYGGSCYSIDTMCSDANRASTLNDKLCKINSHGKLEFIQEGMNMTKEMVSLLSAAVNSTMDYKMPDCPMLYSRVGKDCLSFFSPAKLPWAEARQFCRSIHGDLLHIKDIAAHAALMEYLREELLTSSYWIGGRYDLDTNAWSWTHDDTTMPLGAPYWAVKYEASCVKRSPPHTDPFSSPAPALPGALCSHYVLTPKQRSQGWCSAITYEHFYYWTDEECDETFSPLCILTGPTAITP